MPRYDLIALDIDGTLFTTERSIGPATLARLRAERDAGTTLMLASGRPEHGLRLLAERTGLGLEGLVLSSCNGAAIVDADTEEVVCHRTIAPSLVSRVEDLVAAMPGVTVMSPLGPDLFIVDAGGHNVEHEWKGNGLQPRLVERLDSLPVALHKVLVSAPADVLGPHLDELRGSLAGVAETALSAPFYFEVTAPGVTKGSGLVDFCAARGIDVMRTVAFGDSENDIPMLRAAGTGVAMGNALEVVKEAADAVTLDNNHEGIAAFLER